jgi:nucleotide-binding universal stress UspA family protein
VTRETVPVVIAYDGSEVAQLAVRQAAEIFAGRAAVVVTVWEAGLEAYLWASPTGSLSTLPPDPATVQEINRLRREHASTVAADGAKLARSGGLDAEPQAVADEVDVADRLIEIARERAAAVVVVGSHGISGLRKRLPGGRRPERACLSPPVAGTRLVRDLHPLDPQVDDRDRRRRACRDAGRVRRVR